MANGENERLVRLMLRLGDGGAISLRGLINREVYRRGQALGDIILEHRIRFTGISEDFYSQIFPLHDRVNEDITTWSLSLLILVLKKLFLTSLTRTERNAINMLTSIRSDIPEYSGETHLTEIEFITLGDDLKEALWNLAGGLEADERKKLNSAFNITCASDFSIQSGLRRIRELCEYPTDLLNYLEQSGRGNDYQNSNAEPNSGERLVSGSWELYSSSGNRPTGGQEKDASTSRKLAACAERESIDAEAKQELRSWEVILPNDNDLMYPRGELIRFTEMTHQQETGISDERDESVFVSPPEPFHFAEIESTAEVEEYANRPPEQMPLKSLGYEDDEDLLVIRLDRSVAMEETGCIDIEDGKSRNRIINFPALPGICSTTQNEGDDRGQLVPHQLDDARLNNIEEMLQEVKTLTGRTDNVPQFWQNIDLKLRLESNTASHAAEAEFGLIMLLNKILTEVNLDEERKRASRNQRLEHEDDEETHPKTTPSIINDNYQNQIEGPEASSRHHKGPILATNGNRSGSNDRNHVVPFHSCNVTEMVSPPLVENAGDVIKQRVLSKMFVCNDGQHELCEATLSLLLDIMELGDITVMSAGEGCVLLQIRCRTYNGLANFLKYVKSNRFQSVLNDIGVVLQKQTEQHVRLFPIMPEESIRGLEKFLEKEMETKAKDKSLALSLKYRNIQDLQRIKKYLQSERAKKHLKNISDALAKVLGGTTSLASSIDPIQHKHALENSPDRLLYSRNYY